MNTLLMAWRRDRRGAGHRLRVARERAGLSQLALSSASGVTNDTICRLELGRRSPQAGTIERLAHALGVEPAALAIGEPDPSADWPADDEAADDPAASAALIGRGPTVVPPLSAPVSAQPS